jgi:hypothetical protein
MSDIKRLELPPIKIDYLESLTDYTGILQHTKFTTPRRIEGYATDDNARALLACVKYCKIFSDQKIEELADIYLSFLLYMQRNDGRFHNLLSYDRHFLDDVGSEDSTGRALWACGHTINSKLTDEKRAVAKEIFDKGFRWVASLTSPRAKAFAILGLGQYIKAHPEDNNLTINIETLVEHLLRSYELESSSDWRWFEPYLTYVNGRLPQALFEAYETINNERCLQIAIESFDFLVDTLTINGKFVPIGNNGWYKKGDERALYDQQSIEASCMVETAQAAFNTTGDQRYKRIANTVFEWFLGKNTQNVMVYNPNTGGCYDGITPKGLNLNQGTESTIGYLLARLALEVLK